MKQTLPQLPSELVELISHLMDPADICSFRLTCLKLSKKTFSVFVNTCFSTVRTDLSAKSLQRLDQISLNEHFRHQVQTLFIGCNYNREFGGLLPWFRHQDGFLEELQPSARLLENILVERMPNCRSLYINSGHDDGEGIDTLSATDVVSIVLSIVARRGLILKSFTVDLHGEHPLSRFKGSGSLCAKRLRPLQMWNTMDSTNALAQLEELHLHQDLNSKTALWTNQLIRLATNLKALTLTSDPSNPLESHQLLRLKVQGLQSFCLRNAQVSGQLLLDFLGNSHDTLQALALRSVRMERHADWKLVFQNLQKGFPQLSTVSLFGIKGGLLWPNTPGDNLTMTWMIFPGLSPQLSSSPNDQFKLTVSKKGVIGADYTGKSVKKALQLLEEYVKPLGKA